MNLMRPEDHWKHQLTSLILGEALRFLRLAGWDGEGRKK